MGVGVGVETLYRWKHKYGGMEVSEARRLRAYGGKGEGETDVSSFCEANIKEVSA